MGKGRARAMLDQNLIASSSRSSLNVPPAPVYYPSEEEFGDPLEYIYKIRPEAEPYGICKIVPPKSWKPPFALDLESFTFPTKTQEIHRLQARSASCDPKTFQLEYDRFLEEHRGSKLKKKVVFEGEELDFCKLFNAAKRFGGYDKVVRGKKWGDVYRFVRPGMKISECAKHVLCQLYKEHLYNYENHYNGLSKGAAKGCKRLMRGVERICPSAELPSFKRRRKVDGENVKSCKLEDEEEFDQICEQCKSGLHGEVMLLCDRCNKGWHIYCLSPPLKQIPPGNWYCFECLNSDKDSFGFVPGKCFSLEDFKRLADRAKRKWFGSGSVSRMQIEKKFWEIVEGLASKVEVLYGSDLDTSVYGSGFPRINDKKPESVDPEIWDEYCGSPWNLNNLPKLKGSMLRAVRHNITGVMVPWLYVGMLFSSFCWHFEDHCFYSMNYHHWGEPKCWYSVPGNEASTFEKVMRKTLPDLFDAQPDLLFQLVTMLSPSVLQGNGVPVYTVLQEPGNFVITFPRSFHAGFNFGLNCAEAVNFAPADWLSYGGFGAELYQLYRKATVINHEELLCVVAKGDCDSRALTHLKKELLRVYSKEKTWRERLWRSGILKSSPMAPHKCPEYVGAEEDPTCIICQQCLYLSAVVCRCRPSAFVCLEHWKHLCECKPRKLRLLYRYTLAELHELVLKVGRPHCETPQSNNLKRQTSGSKGSGAFIKKAKGTCVTQAQLAEEWLHRSRKTFQNTFSSHEYATLLKEAEQFLWAGSEMDPVRDVVKNLIEVKKWAEAVRDCFSKVENWSHDDDSKKVHLEYVDELLSTSPMPSIEPCCPKLKDYAEEAKTLSQDIDSTLSTCPTISELELLHSRVSESRFSIRQNEILTRKILCAKAWVDSARKCISETKPAGVELDTLYKLKSEILELQVQLPETEPLLELLRQAESCRARCKEILNGPISPMSVEGLLHELNNYTVRIPELNMLKTYHSDTVSWITRFNKIMVNVHEWEDQRKVVDELTSLLKEGASLSIQVEELPLVEVELKKASCREKAQKACATKMSLDSIEQLMSEAVALQIEKEKLFGDVSRLLDRALHWEERASAILACEAQISSFKELLRMSKDIPVLLPSIKDVENAILEAESWLHKSKPFLISSSMIPASCSLLEIDALKELISQSKLLKVSLEEPTMLEKLLVNCNDWQHNVCSLLQEAECLLATTNIKDCMHDAIILKFEGLISRMEAARKASLSLGFNFDELPKLQNACLKLQWCNKTLSLCSTSPSSEDVESLLHSAQQLSIACASGHLCGFLIEGIKWLKRALEILSLPDTYRRSKLEDAIEVLADSKGIGTLFKVTVGQLEDAIHKHKLWREKAHQFFNLISEERSWSLLLQLNELGKAAAFKCSELDVVLSEIEKVGRWKHRCINIFGGFPGDAISLLGFLQQVKQSLDRSLCIYKKEHHPEATMLCFGCIDVKDQPFLTCSMCEDRYHVGCLGQAQADSTQTEYICSYCQFSMSGLTSQLGDRLLKFGGKHPDVKMLSELLSDAEIFSVRIEEKEMLLQIMEQAATCIACLREILDFALSYLDRDFSSVSQKLAVALKAVNVAGVHDHKTNADLELALARNSWRIKVNNLLECPAKPTLQQVQRHLKEGLALNILPEDYFQQRLTELKCVGLQWAGCAKKVTTDSGALALEKVFELIAEGENLPLHLEKELKLLRGRSMLHCICQKPYEKLMVACDGCGEWYHPNCIRLPSWQNLFVCSACHPLTEDSVSTPRFDLERSTGGKFVVPKTPSPQHRKSGTRPKKTEITLQQKVLAVADPDNTKLGNGIGCLLWRNRKCIRRAAKRRVQIDSLSLFFSNIQQQM